ncbi:mRNA splicing factor [Nadsonia fulvescens var. elongata DSM 6958]|uniref:Pre-mRNA-splicing factor 18 n=1 Tax=Nadsonia fulvescens var. elongata DSM 6958 TaxID=857566 RepID=A0A1E3PPA1_9ASCO|nr:mRNA splicing factor [Nadsonia fulvescens var. elongata DSM 6958]
MGEIEESANDTELKTKILLQARSYMKFLIQTWEDVVAKRTVDMDQLSTKANAVLKETKASLIPLLVLLRKGELSETVFPLLMGIFYHLQKKNFRAANDSYIKLSIGNAPWPIGVTAVGIHARSAREKITGENSEANIMKDDMTRSWLVAIKRLITFAEGHWSE